MTDFKELTSKNFENLNVLTNKLEKDLGNSNSKWYSNKKEYCDEISQLYSVEFEKVPAIFRIIQNNNYEFNTEACERLKFMISQASRVFNKDIAEHDASVAVGTKLVDEIVKPQLKNN